MSVLDATAIDLSAKTGGNPPPSTPPAGDKPAGAPATDKKEGAPAVGEPKEHPQAIQEMLDRYGLNSLKELDAFLGKSTTVLERIGDADPEELLRDSKDLQRYRKEWAKEERAKAKASETPEQTIERLEREAEERERNFHSKEKDRERALKAQESLNGYNRSTGEYIDTLPEVKAHWRPLVKAIMGVKSPVNSLDLGDRKGAKELTKSYALKLVIDAMDEEIKSYRSGKTDIPNVPNPQGAAPAVTETDAAPKNLTEARRALHLKSQSLLGIFGKK